MAIFGMSALLLKPSNLLRGRRELLGSTLVVAQSATVGNMMRRRHLPICTTSGIWLCGAIAVVGTLERVNFPVTSVWATATALSIAPAQESQFAPVLNAGRLPLGSSGT